MVLSVYDASRQTFQFLIEPQHRSREWHRVKPFVVPGHRAIRDDGLKLVLISSDYLGQIREYAQRMAEGPWRTVLYIDDMTFDPRHYESFKIGRKA